MKPIAIVIPWFGRELKGGAEQQAWQVSTRLAARGHQVEILTTCCRSFQEDWSVNHLPAGEVEEDGLTIRRFKVRKRDNDAFNHANAQLLALLREQLKPGVNPVSRDVTETFVRENIHAPDLISHLEHRGKSYQAVIFIPYLYGPILVGLHQIKDRAYLQPCLHDECYAYLPQVADLFRAAKRILYLSEGEEAVATRLYSPAILTKGVVVGAGVELREQPLTTSSAEGLLVQTGRRFLLSLGRRDTTKNTDLLLRAYIRFRKDHPRSSLGLVLAGPNKLPAHESTPGIIDLGLVSEVDKEWLLSHCTALIQPSRNESYSRVVMEAWFHGKPVAIHRDCLATSMAITSSGGGWMAASEEEWTDLLTRFDQADGQELARLGKNGRAYTEKFADWDKVMDRYEEVLGLRPQTVKRVSSNKVSRKLKAIHQLLPNLAYGDAISNHAIYLHDWLRSQGYLSEIYVRYLDNRMSRIGQVFRAGVLDKKDGLIYHHSIGSELTEYAIKHSGPKCLIYHNITPPHFFKSHRPEFADLLHRGRRELCELASHFPLSLGDSAYNAQELAEAGFPAPGVLPISIDPSKWSEPPDSKWMNWLQDGHTNLIFVGRLAPNKCQHHLIEAFSRYLTFDPAGRLIIVGCGDSNDPYVQHLHRLTDQLHLSNKVVFTGQLTDAQLQACYQTAHLFWSMSEHEGFGIPLVEAMWFDVPVLAYKSSAVPETLGEGGLMFSDKSSWDEVSALAKLMAHDDDLRTKILQAQRRRRLAFFPDSLKENYATLVAMLESA